MVWYSMRFCRREDTGLSILEKAKGNEAHLVRLARRMEKSARSYESGGSKHDDPLASKKAVRRREYAQTTWLCASDCARDALKSEEYRKRFFENHYILHPRKSTRVGIV